LLAELGDEMDSGDISWILASTVLVMLMVPGVGLFYAGMVRRKNAVAMIALSFLSLSLVSIQWVILGYTLSFGSDVSGLIGRLDFIGLRGIEEEISGLPTLTFVAFQLMFAAITLAILTSAVAERVKLSAFILFGLLWTTLVYDPLAHWVWGNGWLAELGALDFAGGTVVHISSGFSALALAIVIGKRREFGEYSIEPHNVPMALLGAALLWFGWFGFNGGSALAANGLAANAFLVTNLAAASGALSWMLVSWFTGKPSSLGMVSGAIAGLVAITPAAGYVDVLSSLIIGSVAGTICYRALLFRVKMGLDESLDAWAIHGVGGLWGAIATGIFATMAVNEYSGLLYGNVEQFMVQVLASLAAIVYAFVVTFVLAKIIDLTIGLRVSEEEEYVGLDISQHGEKAYA
jgi:Amt family ammonium transporter